MLFRSRDGLQVGHAPEHGRAFQGVREHQGRVVELGQSARVAQPQVEQAGRSCESPPAPLSQGPCPDNGMAWVDGSFVDMGCLFFNDLPTNEPMTWLESMRSCQLRHENAFGVEIISAEVFIEFKLSNLYIHKTLQQMDYIKVICSEERTRSNKKILLCAENISN